MTTQLSVELPLTDIENIIELFGEIEQDGRFELTDDEIGTLAKIQLAKERMATNVPVEDEKSV